MKFLPSWLPKIGVVVDLVEEIPPPCCCTGNAALETPWDAGRVLGQRGGEEPGGDVTEAPLYCTGWLVGWLVGGGERGWLQGPELDVGSGAGVRTRVYEQGCFSVIRFSSLALSLVQRRRIRGRSHGKEYEDNHQPRTI